MSFAKSGFTQCNDKNTSFITGEEVHYEVYYNWAFFWLKAGNVSFSVREKQYQKKKYYHFFSVGRSLPEYDWFFMVRDTFQTIVDYNKIASVYFHRQSYEGDYFVESKYTFDYDKKLIYTKTESTRKPYKEDTLKLQNCTFDVLACIYYARNINYNNYNINDTIPIRMIIDNEVFDLYIRYLGKETITTKFDETYDCIKFKPLLVEGTIFSGGEKMTVWVTNDENKIPVMVEAKIVVGYIRAFVTNYYNTRYPVKKRK